MKIIITEERLSKLIRNVVKEQYEPDKLFARDFIMSRVWRRDKKTKRFIAPKVVRDAAKGITAVKQPNDIGKETAFVKIPQIIYTYIFGRY